MTAVADGRPDLAALSRDRLLSMREAANEALTCQHVLAKTGHTVVSETVGGGSRAVDSWVHYPSGDVYDPEHHAQYYFHVHPVEERTGDELGHFHLFLRREGIPLSAAPPVQIGDGLCHLIAISVDRTGHPIRLFTTNQWVTGETWFKASIVATMLGSFIVGHAQPSWPVNRWVTAMVRLYRPEIAWLLAERDRIFDVRKGARTDQAVLEDRSLEVLSMLDIDLADRVDALDTALRQQRRAAAAASSVAGP